MARPQVFISSTFYDLKIVRDDIARAMREMGYDTIRNEVGSITYSRQDKLEVSCYREIDNCDVLVCIIGNRYGTGSTISTGSITQNELRTAYEKGKQVYIFVEKNVLSERAFFNKNKNIPGLAQNYENEIKIYTFIDEVDNLPTGNPLFSFETASDIILILKEQLAGLFQRLLSENSKKEQLQLMDELKSSIATVGELAKFLSTKADAAGVAVNQILLTDHPLFQSLKNILGIKYRVYFLNLNEMNQWLLSTRGLNAVEKSQWDNENYPEWYKQTKDAQSVEYGNLLKVWSGLFDKNGVLKPINKDQWKDDYVSYKRYKLATGFDDMDDDIPF